MTMVNEDTWVVLPSLLTDLDEEHRQSLEAAYCAGISGRVQDADRVFTQAFPDPVASTAATLNWSEILRFYQRHHERQQLLRAVAKREASDQGTALTLLISLLLAESDYWTAGLCQPLIDGLLDARRYFKTRTAADLTDIEIRAITLYYAATDQLSLQSNHVRSNELTCYLDDGRYGTNRYDECRAIRQALQTAGRLRYASVLVQLEMRHCHQPDARVESMAAYQDILDAVMAASHSPLKFRGAVLAKQKANALQDPQARSEAAALHEQFLRELTPAAHATWHECFPIRAEDEVLASVLSSEDSLNDRFEALTVMIDSHIADNNFTAANLVFSEVEKMLVVTLDPTRVEGNDDVKHLLRLNLDRWLQFHRETTKSAVHEASALIAYVEDTRAEPVAAQVVLGLLRDYTSKHKAMEVPALFERLCLLAIAAAREVGDDEVVVFFERAADSILHCTKHMPNHGGLAPAALNYPDRCLQMLTAAEHNPVNTGINALDLMLRWAAYDVTNGTISALEVGAIFTGPSLQYCTSLNRSCPDEQLWDLSVTIFESICLINTNAFVNRYQKLFDWAMVQGGKVSSGTRLCALRLVLKARLHQVEHATMSTSVDVLARAEILDRERLLLKHIDTIGMFATRLENDFILRRCRLAIHQTVPEHSLSDIDRAIHDCHVQIDWSQSKQDHAYTYQLHLAWLQLRWHKFTSHQSPTEAEEAADQILEVVDQAAVSYHTLQKSSLEPDSQDIVSGVEARGHAYASGEHFKYAFAVLEACLTRSGSDASFTDRLASYALDAKGVGYIRNVAADVASSNPRTGSTATPTQQHQSLTPEQIRLVSIRNIHPSQIQTMVDTAVDDIAIIDIIDLKHSAFEQSWGALVYRKGQPLSFVKTHLRSPAVDVFAVGRPTLRDNADATRYNLMSLQPLVARFVSEEATDGYIPKGTTMIWCLGDKLSQLPISAIDTVDGKLITRNPLVCVDSLSHLYDMWLGSKHWQQAVTPSRTLLVDSRATSKVNELSGMPYEALNTVELSAEVLLDNAKDLQELSFLTEVTGDPFSPSQSALHLRPLTAQHWHIPQHLRHLHEITATDIVKQVTMQSPSICTIVKFDHGHTSSACVNDVLSLPAAAHLAGATSAVACRWPLLHDDARRFLTDWRATLTAAALTAVQPSGLSDEIQASSAHVNLAKVMQSVLIERLRSTEDDHREQPYAWASPFLSGLWFTSATSIPSSIDK